MRHPALTPYCSGWQADLPHPEETPNVIPSLGLDNPNEQNAIYLEFRRPSSLARGVLLCFAFIMALQTIAMLAMIIISWNIMKASEIALIYFPTLFVLIWLGLMCYKIDVCAPRDLPIRFNRLRNRIYAYNFEYRWWNPFERWKVSPVAYDWSQVRAERWRKQGATTHGAIIKWGVVLSIVKPGSNEVIDRFHLSTMGADEHAWAYICTYMQHGPSALPPPGPPRDHNDVPWYNLALRLAPRVEWPVEMDRESTTAPSTQTQLDTAGACN